MVKAGLIWANWVGWAEEAVAQWVLDESCRSDDDLQKMNVDVRVEVWFSAEKNGELKNRGSGRQSRWLR